MSVGLRFGFGPLVAYVPLTGRKRRGRHGPSVTGQAVAAGVTGLAKLYWWALVLAFFLLAWPYLVIRWAGDRNGWSTPRAVGTGLVATAAWLLLAVVMNALMGGSPKA
ncbi:hypothetical protein [Microtetraspora malaysiensis]|uniref:hypothetical protein n=1 Tax=Microtetraspora malaysiensis TaxID=161358 RepID=UPI003D91423F